MHSKRSLLAVAAAILSLAALAPAVAATPRSGDVHITKECSAYNGAAGEHCTITSSNVAAIPVGSQVIYLEALASPYTVLDTDIVLDPPGPGSNRAFGHVRLDLTTGAGVVTFSGGTGKFTWFHATTGVSYLGGTDWAWEGTYDFGPAD
jgi:hypothetical protein